MLSRPDFGTRKISVNIRLGNCQGTRCFLLSRKIYIAFLRKQNLNAKKIEFGLKIACIVYVKINSYLYKFYFLLPLSL